MPLGNVSAKKSTMEVNLLLSPNSSSCLLIVQCAKQRKISQFNYSVSSSSTAVTIPTFIWFNKLTKKKSKATSFYCTPFLIIFNNFKATMQPLKYSRNGDRERDVDRGI